MRIISASAAECLFGNSSGSAHQQHQLDCMCGDSRAACIISISCRLPLRKQPGQCASSASAGYCLSGNNPGSGTSSASARHCLSEKSLARAHDEHKLCSGSAGNAHHQHQLHIACLVAAGQHASSASVGFCQSRTSSASANQQHQLGSAWKEQARVVCIISIS